MTERWHGYYATRIYLPLSSFSRRWRRSAHLRQGREGSFLQSTLLLPEVPWASCAGARTPRVWEPRKQNGNVRISELGVLSALAAGCEDRTDLFEIGTFDGRTTLNLALNSPPQCRVLTLDLPPDLAPRYQLAPGERHMVEKTRPGSRCEKYRCTHPGAVAKIHQLLGDSATFDFRPYHGSCSLVFVDGSHAYEYTVADSRTALELVRPGGIIVWHDYGIWEGVTRALGELEQGGHYDLKNIRGTSLVYWKNPKAGGAPAGRGPQ